MKNNAVYRRSGEAAQHEAAHPSPYCPHRHPGPAGGARAANMAAAAEQKGCGGGAARGRPPAEADAALPHGAALRPRRPSPTAPGAARFQAEAPPGPGRLFVLRHGRENGERPASPARLPTARPSNGSSEPARPPTRSGEKKLNGKKAEIAKKSTQKPQICLRAPSSSPRRTDNSPPHPSNTHPQEQPQPRRLLAGHRRLRAPTVPSYEPAPPAPASSTAEKRLRSQNGSARLLYPTQRRPPSASASPLSTRGAGSESRHRLRPPFCARESEKPTRKWRPLGQPPFYAAAAAVSAPFQAPTALPPHPNCSPSLRPCPLPRVPAATKGRGRGKRRGGRGREPGTGAGEGKGGARGAGRVSESLLQKQQPPDAALRHLHREPTRRRV